MPATVKTGQEQSLFLLYRSFSWCGFLSGSPMRELCSIAFCSGLSRNRSPGAAKVPPPVIFPKYLPQLYLPQERYRRHFGAICRLYSQRVIQPEQQFGFSRLKGIVFGQIGVNFLDSRNLPRVCDQRARTEGIQLFHVGKVILAQAFYQFCSWICLGRRKPVKFLVCADFLQQFADRKAVGISKVFFGLKSERYL